MRDDEEFARRLTGKFYGVLRWQDLDALWDRVRNEPEGWFVSLTGAMLPDSPLSAEELKRFVDGVDALLGQEHREDYCGIVYADDLETPTLVKIYDPNNLGSSCGMHGGAHPPRWLLSRLRPEAIADTAPLPNVRKRWWQALFG
ncbi:hypothetical protein [Sulfuricystis thermophila]|uniref:hypothetical protein n=1 Tax=Sulfuricystis thermophila TaxID=2496847 RepID=UPI001035E59E|nr:hypothetical protein [Sulfuricystis thermophila]